MKPVKVRHYDYARAEYASDNRQVDVLMGGELLSHLGQQYKGVNSRAVRSYMRDQGIRVDDVLAAAGVDLAKFGGMPMSRIFADDQLRPWFAPATEDGFRLGLQSVQDKWEQLIGTTVPIDAATAEYFNLQAAGTSDGFAFKSISQGALIPVATITVGKQSIVLEKSGRGLQWVREAMRAPINVSQLWLKVLGMRLGRSYLSRAAGVLVNGYLDDNSDDPIVVNTATGHVFTMSDLLFARYTMSEVYGYEPDNLVLSLNTFIGLMNLQWPTSGFLVFPNGVASMKELLMVNNVQIVNALADEQIIFENKDAALVRYEADAFATEDDYIPAQQVYATYGTLTDQIVVGIKEARLILNANHS